MPMICRNSLAVLLLVALSAGAQTTRYVNGRWFNGETFVPDEVSAVNGTLTHRPPPGDVKTVDLAGGFVVPPFADAHCHLPDSIASLPRSEPQDLTAGVFYVLNPNDIAELSNAVRGRTAIDILFAHAGFTGPTGHPRKLYERLSDLKFVPFQKSELEGRAFYAIRTTSDLDRDWPGYLASKPDFTKIYLLYSDTKKAEGLTHALARDVVRRAHRARLRVGAHVETARDFHRALEAGVDFVMHLPGYYRNGLRDDAFVLAATDVERAARAHTYVVTTSSLLDEGDEALLRIQNENLRKLKAAGVPIIIGSDQMPGVGFSAEAGHLSKSGVFTNVELLQMMTTTSRAIFPGRQVGCLRDGCEASFLVLSGDPVADFDATKKIAMRVKRGVLLDPAK